jgi:Zn-dependent protease with chaperone function
MSFFDNQLKARRHTGMLIVLYALCVCLITLGVYAVLAIISQNSQSEVSVQRLWNPALFLGVSAITLAIVGLGSLYKILQLSKGGAAVAQMLGGRSLQSNSNDPDERKILNVVEEMAIAAGVGVPPVYVLPEDSINAFAAGFTPKNAVIGVTQGSIQQLSRDELQGVVAHEFSHIFNGDMRLNLRLICVLHGILVLSLIGYYMMRVTAGSGSRRSSKDDNGQIGAALFFTGLSVMIIGYVGAFFASLIKSAVSRQREYLADASAVQFTRNPDGIGGALKKIASLEYGSLVTNPAAEQASHFFFAEGLKTSFFRLFATHPPLSKRLECIFGKNAAELESLQKMEEQPSPRTSPEAYAAVQQLSAGSSKAAAPAAGREELHTTVGRPQQAHLDYSRDLLASLSPQVRDMMRDPSGARAVVIALLLDSDEEIRARQLQAVREQGDELLYKDLNMIGAELRFAGAEYSLPLMSAAIPALRALPKSAYSSFRKLVQFIIEADRRCSLLEYALQRMLQRRLDPLFLGAPKKAAASTRASDLNQAAFDLLTCLAFLGNRDPQKAEQALSRGLSELGSGGRNGARNSPSLNQLDRALNILEGAPLALREKVLKASIVCAMADANVTVEEAELVRAIADGLDCPLPPFSPDTPS